MPVNPTTGLKLPRIRSRRDRVADPEEAAALLAVLATDDRPIWATAFYAGLRRGELKALRWQDVDLAGGRINVLRGWDSKEGAIETKGNRRRVTPVPAVLRSHLVDLKMRRGEAEADGLVFGTGGSPFREGPLVRRADKAWKTAALKRITLHECRHTFASLMIAAGVNAKALSTFMGHSSIKVTFDLYGHLMPGNEEEAGLLDAYLERAHTQARLAAVS